MTGQLSQTILVSRLRATRCLPGEQIEQVFDAINAPGIAIICVSTIGSEGEFEKISQTYEFDRLQYEDLDDALLAWDTAQQAA